MLRLLCCSLLTVCAFALAPRDVAAGQEPQEVHGPATGTALWRSHALGRSIIDWTWLMGGDASSPVASGSTKKGKKVVTFADVGGATEAKRSLQDIVDYLKTPDRYIRLGAKPPKGVLLSGPPGTGKTLLARALAGEAGVPFFSASGSSFDDMYIGQGAHRVRSLFASARARAPAIVFIDEIDAVGARRSNGMEGQNEKANTLNQLLVEMDGFGTAASGIIVLAATNRPDFLDEALTRSGRFDRRVTMDLPNAEGRRQILGLHTAHTPLAYDVDLDAIARDLPPMSGADLANLANTAALYAARAEREQVNAADWRQAEDDVVLGVSDNLTPLSGAHRHATAVHEAGHATVATALVDHPGVKLVTIRRRGHAAGVTRLNPRAEAADSRAAWMSHLATAMGGRAAERLEFGIAGAGVSNDLAAAKQLAYTMVTAWGMGARVGTAVAPGGPEHAYPTSENFRAAVDGDVADLLNEAEQLALSTLSAHQDGLRSLVEALITHETLSGTEVHHILGVPPKEVSR